MTSSSNDTDRDKLTIETILDLFADEAAEYGEPRAEALARAQAALAVYTERVKAEEAARIADLINERVDIRATGSAQFINAGLTLAYEIAAEAADLYRRES